MKRDDAMATIVNVDDNEPSRYARARLLKETGFRVIDAATGREALEAVRLERPDLVLLDVNLPDISGIDVCRQIREDPQISGTVVVQISASATSAPQAILALDTGADLYLTEPVDHDVLVATVKAMLRARRAERQAHEANRALTDANKRLVRLNEELQRSNEDLQHFAYVASHDLREPLRTIRSYVQLIGRSLMNKLEDHERAYLDFIGQGTERMWSLIDALLAFARIGRDLPAEFGVLPLKSPLDWALMNLHEAIVESKAEIIVRELPTVWGDSVQLAQVFQNLIENALKYGRSDCTPTVEITAAQHTAQEWIITVGDNGVGIPKEYQERIFVPFKRLHGRELPGSGIGLALCRRIILGHGGRIWVESDGNSGSRFHFSLRPAAEAI
jgi:two-component system, sensor histidine kinase and response regulator